MRKYLQPRIKKIQKLLRDQEFDYLLISDPINIRYLTSFGVSPFEREAFVILGSDTAILLVSSLSVGHFASLKSLYQIETLSFENRLSDVINALPEKTLGFESHNMTVLEHNRLKKKSTKDLVSAQNLIKKIRQVKDEWEIRQIKKACSITYQTWKEVKPKIKPGKTEKEIAELILATQKQLGAEGIPQGFNPIVAAGKHSAIPHHVTSDTVIKENDVVLCDFGCQVAGYASDFTRTIYLGKPTEKFTQVEQIIKDAYQEALNLVKAGSSVSDIDLAANQIVEANGFGQMIHTTGHGLGLSIHEAPSVSRHAIMSDLAANMCITIEPGIYLENKFGYRHENTVLVTEDGYQILTK